MAKIKVIQLTDQQRLQLDEGFRQGKSHAYRMRCRAVLLKSAGLTSEQVGFQTEMSHISVNSWVKRFEAEGIKGLETRPGRGRKPIMDSSDEEAVRILCFDSSLFFLFFCFELSYKFGSSLNGLVQTIFSFHLNFNLTLR